MSKRIRIILFSLSFFLCFLFLAVIGLFIYIHSDLAGHQIQTRINERIPGKIMFKDFSIALSKGKIELENILMEDPEGRVVAGIDQLVLQISWRDLFSRSVSVEHIFIKNPQVRLIVNPDGSLSLVNLFVSPRIDKHPETPEKPLEAGSSFNFVIRDFLLENGTLAYENQNQDSTAKLENIRLNFSGNFAGQNWLFDLSAGKGAFESTDVESRIEILKLSGEIREEQIKDLKLQLKTVSSDFELTGSARRIFSDPELDLIMNIGLSLSELRETFILESEYTGNITGELSARGPAKNPDVTLNLTYSGGQLGDVHIQKSHLQAMVIDRIIQLAPVELQFGTGYISGEAKSDFREVFPEGFLSPPQHFDFLSYNLNLDVNDVNLKEALGRFFEGRGIINGTIFAKGKGVSPENAVAELEVDITGTGITTDNLSPVDIRITSAAGLSEGKGILNAFEVLAGPTELFATGHFDIQSNQLESYLSINSKNLERTLAPLGIKGFQGIVKLEAKASGTLDRPVADLQLTGENLAADFVPIGKMKIAAKLSEGNLLIQKAELENQKSRVGISGKLGIFEQNRLKPLDDPSIDLTLIADSVFLEDFTDQVSGKVFLSARIEGSKKNPKGDYELIAEQIQVTDQNIERILAQGNLANEKFHLSPFEIVFASSQSIQGSGWISTDRKFQVQLFSEGISLDQIDVIRQQNIAEGLLVFNLTGDGTLGDPGLRGHVAVNNLVVKQKELGNVQMELKLADFLAEASGHLNFDFSASYHLNKKDFWLNLHFDDTDLSPYFNLTDLKNVSGTISGNMEASGNMSNLRQTSGAGNFSLLNLSAENQELVHAENFEIVYRNNQVLIPDLKVRLLEAGHLNIDANADLDGPLRVIADGTIPLQGLRMVTGKLPDISGELQISAEVAGTTAKPDIRGEIILNQIGFTIPELLQKIHGVSGRIFITPEALHLDNIQGNLDTGRLELSGQLALKDLNPERIRLDLTASSLPLKVPDTMNVILQSNLRLSGTPESALLQGEIIVIEGVYYKDINANLVESVTQRRRQISPQKPASTNPMLKNLNLDVSVRRRNPFLVENNLANLDINPDIRIAGTADQPMIQGRTTIESGTIQYQRKTFTVQKGVIDFINPYELEPTMDIESTVKIRKWMITLTLYGTPDNMILTLMSDPPEEHGDIISLLVLGKTTRELIGREGGTSRTTEQMAAELLAGTFGDDIRRITGLDFFEVETELDNNSDEESEGVMVTVGKKLSDRLTLKYAADSRRGEMIHRAISEYQLLENIIISAFQDTFGIFGGEILYRLEFR